MIQSKDLEARLYQYFHFNHFREGQKEIITDVMAGKDVLGILPTGSGKSLCYQLPAMLLSGTTVVISPLISLMNDQVNQLKAMNFKKVIAFNSFIDFETRRRALKNLSAYKLIYLSPELLQDQHVQNQLKRISISLFVVDEAHCISQWGHEFRPDYLKLNDTIQLTDNPPVLALSATAPQAVQNDIIHSLKRPNMVKHIYPMDRENIAFSICKVQHDTDKMEKITNLLETYHVPTLIYFSSRRATEKVTDELLDKLPTKRIAFYHGGMEPIDRIAIQQQFMNDQLDVICCTSAFGMGINKNNIRLIIHFHFPPQLEAFIQEVGRAGRNGKTSVSVLLYSEQDTYLPQNMIEQELPTENQLKHVLQYVSSMPRNQIIPKFDDEMAHKLQVNEIQWRFIHYQLEKNDILSDNKVVDFPKHWGYVFDMINAQRKKRQQLKQAKLMKMIAWMNETDCFRKHLYKHFQRGYQTPTMFCCSNCGLSWDKWQPEQSVNKNKALDSWQVKLKKLLYFGENDESK